LVAGFRAFGAGLLQGLEELFFAPRRGGGVEEERGRRNNKN
jgi:hypothetical protein